MSNFFKPLKLLCPLLWHGGQGLQSLAVQSQWELRDGTQTVLLEALDPEATVLGLSAT